MDVSCVIRKKMESCDMGNYIGIVHGAHNDDLTHKIDEGCVRCCNALS